MPFHGNKDNYIYAYFTYSMIFDFSLDKILHLI